MAEEINKLQDKPPTLRAALMNMDPKIALAFFLTTIAALMVIILLAVLVIAGPSAIDAGTIALIASMIMLFIKMAADATGYQTQSSAGSDKKDDVNAEVTKKLTSLPNGSAAPDPWWNRLTDAERTAITTSTDQRVKDFVAAPVTSKPLPDDLAYLVTKGLLTPERSKALQSA